MASTPIETDFNALFANPNFYAKQYGEGLASLEELIKFSLEKKLRTIACCRGDSGNYAYIYFACKENELPYFKVVINILKEENITDFNYEIRAFVNFKDCDYLRGVIFRANPVDADKLFIKIKQGLELRNSLSVRNYVDYFSYIIFQFKMKQLDIKDLKLIYEDNQLYIKFSEFKYELKNETFYLNGDIKKLSSLLEADSIADFRGKFYVDEDKEKSLGADELISGVNQRLTKVLKKT